VTDRTNPDAEEQGSNPDKTASDPDPTAADIYESEHLPATRQTRMRPNALDLERPPD
jgi:hypothetical protein